MAKKQNVLDVLLGAETGKLQKPTKEVKISSLSKSLGQEVKFVVKGLDGDEYEKVQENSMSIKGKDFDINMSDLQVFTILEGTVEPNLKSKELREHYNAPTPKELVKKLLLSGEISKLYNVISDLSGFGEDTVDEVKN